MSGVFRFIDLVGTSARSLEDAIQSAIAEASTTAGKIYWFEVKEIRGRVDRETVAEYQVSLRIATKSE